SGMDRHRKDAAILQWTFSLQHEIASGTTLQASYLGSEGYHLFQRVIYNGVDPATGQRPFPGYNTLDSRSSYAVGNFNALHIGLQRDFGSGVGVLANYRWPHAINDGSLGGGESSAPMNMACRSCDRSESSQGIRHYFSSSLMWKVPVGRGQR